jgi:hypothetical protein
MTDRQKRLKRLVVYVPESLGVQLELFKEEDSKIISMSDYLHDVIEDFVARKSAIRITRQQVGRRLVNS